jgi:peptidoglycan hydrolase-like protein with peptidoglycan-binding domain
VINGYLNAAASKYNVPPQALKVIAYKESNWRQFTTGGTTVLSSDGGIGMMQLTGDTARQFDYCRLHTDTAYNIDSGAAVLSQKWAYTDSVTPGTPARTLIENWYLPIRRYNGGGAAANSYVADAVSKMASPPSAIASFTTPITVTRPASVYSSYQHPSPYLAATNGTFSFYNYEGTTLIATRTGTVHTWGGGSSGGGATPVTLDFAAYSTLRNGSTGSQVKALQSLLNAQGYNAGTVDGAFGSGTEAAVKRAQSAKGLGVDGVVGARTWTALLSAGTRPTLKSGSNNDDVRRLQRALTAALGRTVGIDGDFGPQTDKAVRDYQASRGLNVDGIVGSGTWGALQAGR